MHLTYRKILYVLSVILTMGAQLAEIYSALCLHPAFSPVFSFADDIGILRRIALPCILFTVCLLILTEESSAVSIRTVLLCVLSASVPAVGIPVYYNTDSVTAGYTLSAVMFTLTAFASVNLLCDVIARADTAASTKNRKLAAGVILLLMLPAALLASVMTVKYPGAQMFALFYSVFPLEAVCALLCRLMGKPCGYITAAMGAVYCAGGMILPFDSDIAVLISGGGFALCWLAASAVFGVKELAGIRKTNNRKTKNERI